MSDQEPRWSVAYWLREFADAMEKDPDGWWRGHEYQSSEGVWVPIRSPQGPVQMLMHGYPIRRKPRTVTRYDRHGEPVKLPKPLQTELDLGKGYWICTSSNATQAYEWGNDSVDADHFAAGNCFATQADAQAWADYFKSLLETRDD